MTFVVSLRLGEPADARRRCARGWTRYPACASSSTRRTTWTDELVAAARGDRRGRQRRLQGPVRGHASSTVAADPALYRARRRGASPTPGSRTRAPTPETDAVLEPHRDRITWDAPSTASQDIEALPFPPTDGQRQAVAPRRPAPAARRLRPLRRARHPACTAAASSSSAPGRGQIQYLASLFHPDGPNDVAPGGYNDPEPPAGLPDQPAARRRRAPTGFRWG